MELHPIQEIKFNKYRNSHIANMGHEAYREFEKNKVIRAVANITSLFLESFNYYDEDAVVTGIAYGFDSTHRAIQADSVNGLVKAFGEISKRLESGNYDPVNHNALKVIKNMYAAAMDLDVIDFIEKKNDKTFTEVRHYN